MATYKLWTPVEEYTLMENFKNNKSLPHNLTRSEYACKIRVGKLLAQEQKNKKCSVLDLAKLFDKKETIIEDYLTQHEEKQAEKKLEKQIKNSTVCDEILKEIRDLSTFLRSQY